jgi:arylsulfatase A-like enzyme/Tfp pilus assembly protein PilF
MAQVTALASLLACARSDSGSEAGTIRQELAGQVPSRELNVVLVTIDTLRADRLSSFGSRVRTPNLDRLAGEGVLFTNASTTVPFTFPAHSSIMTGTYPPFHGVRENVGYYLGDENITLAERMSETGRQTAGFVSAFVLDSRWGIGRGFDHYFDDFDLAAFENANIGSVQRPGTETIEAALGWLDEKERQPAGAQPFFLWLHLFDPHDPYTPPEPFRSQYPGQPYDAEVAYTDELVGGFLDDLERRGLLDRTLIVLTADHGEGLGDHGENSHGFFVYDSTVHVPLIVRFPGRHLAGTRIDAPVSHVDIVPTILEMTGQGIPERLQGRSLLPVLENARENLGTDDLGRVVYAESFYPLLHYGWAPLRTLRSRTHKYIETPKPELFDLTADPTERNDLTGSDERTARRMARTLFTLGNEIAEGAVETTTADLDEQALAQLQALGYLAGPGQEDARTYDPSIERTDPKEKIHLHRRIMGAQGLVGSGKADEAASLLREALSEDPDLLDAHQMLGRIELDADRPEAAAQYFLDALALDDRHKPSISGLAACHRAQGRIDEALLGYRRVLALAGQDSAATLAIADIEVDRGNLQAAEEILRHAAQPGAPALFFNRLGEVQILAGRPGDARRNLRKAIESNPELSQPYFNLAILSEDDGDLEDARRRYEQAIDKAPKHYKAQFNLARLMARLGDASRERELLEQSITSKPDFAIGHFFLGKSLMEEGNLERAEEVTRSGLEHESDNQFGWLVLADILNRQGKPGQANDALATARSLS